MAVKELIRGKRLNELIYYGSCSKCGGFYSAERKDCTSRFLDFWGEDACYLRCPLCNNKISMYPLS